MTGRAALPSLSGGSTVGELEGGGGDIQQQLKYENEKLKLALAQRFVIKS